jgi:hypothetical protein
VTRPRAADDFGTIRARIEELHRELLKQNAIAEECSRVVATRTRFETLNGDEKKNARAGRRLGSRRSSSRPDDLLQELNRPRSHQVATHPPSTL